MSITTAFKLREATVLVDRREDMAAVPLLNMRVVLYDDVIQGRVRVEGQLLVASNAEPLAKIKELVAGGVSHADVRYVDLDEGASLLDMATYQRDRLRSLFSESQGVMSDRVRLLSQWPVLPPWQPWSTGDPTMDEFLRWRPRNLAVIVGDEGSGKSTFSQILTMKLMTGEPLWSQGARASICAWEDDREMFRQMVWRFCGQLEPRLYWFEPDADPDRLLDEYLSNVERLAVHEGVKIHIADPWNSFSHEIGGDLETKYVHKMLLEMQKLTRQLDITIMVVTHLPKRPGRGLRPFGIADAAMSKGFADKADMGFCVANTRLIATLADKTDKQLEGLRLARSHVDGALSAHGSFLGKEHMIVVTDKVKVRGMEERCMGLRTVRAFVLDKDACSLVVDNAATELAKLLWD